MNNLLNNKLTSVHFNECNNIAFHDLSRNNEATSVCDLTPLLSLCPKLFTQKDKFTFKPSKDMIVRLRRDIRTMWFVLNNVNAYEMEEVRKLHRNNVNREPDKARGPLEGDINRFEQALRVEFGTLKKRKSSNFT